MAKTLTKRELAVTIADETDLPQREVMEVIQKGLDHITDALANGQTVEFRNFGVFEPDVRKSRLGRNPNRPERTVEIPRRVVAKFKPGKVMKERMRQLDPDKIEEEKR